MDIKKRFYEWLLANKVHKESKAKEIIAIFEIVDEKCVRSKGDGQFSLFDFVDLKKAKHIRNTFLLNKQISVALGKSNKIYNKNIDLLFEFYDVLSTMPQEQISEDELNEVTEEGLEKEITESENSISENTESQDEAEPLIEKTKIDDVEASTPLDKERVLINKAEDVFSNVSENVKLVSEAKDKSNTEDVSVYIDLINAQMGVKRKNNIAQQSLAEIYLEKDHIYEKNSRVFLEEQEKLSVYNEIFVGNSKKRVIEKSIYHSLKDFQLEYKGIYAILPDVLDEFAKETRSQLIYKGERVFPIPRSIAYALGRQYNLQRKRTDFSHGSEIIFADYDGNEFVAIQLDVVKDESAKYSIFVRKGIKKVPNGHLNYNSLFDFCIGEYKRKYGISFDESAVLQLKSTKAFSTLFNTREPILIKQSTGYIRLVYDKSIHDRVIDKIDADVGTLCKELKISRNENVIIGSSLYGTKGVEYVGCSIVQERIKEQKPLWREYLPQLSLEVINDGRYGEIELIKKNEYRDVLKTLGEEEIIYVNGTLTFAKGKEYYSLPLERNIENDINKEKQSVFKHPSFPLNESVKVSLEIRYKYGDENSYKLVAKPLSENAPFDKIENEWVDRDPLPLGKVSKFVSNGGMPLYEDDLDVLRKAFDEFRDKLQSYRQEPYKRERLLKLVKQGKNERITLLYQMTAPRIRYVKKRVFNDEMYSNNEDAKNLIDKIAKSSEFAELVKIAGAKGEIYKSFEKASNKETAIKIRDFARDFVSDMGNLHQVHVDYEAVEIFKRLGEMKYLAQLSRCLTTDDFGVYDTISRILLSHKPNEDDVRTLGSNCNYISDWAKNLYSTENGTRALEVLRDRVIELIQRHNLKPDGNPRIIRDYMELLVSLCTINELDSGFINPNELKIKKLVKKIKKLDSYIDECSETLQYPFVCRLQTENLDKKELDGMNDLTFMLVQILTGAQDINLTGFEDNDG